MQIKITDYIRLSIYAALIYAIYASSLHWLVIKDWEREGYSYCYLIPFVVIYLLYLKWDAFKSMDSRPSWWGLMPFLWGLSLFWLGELGGEFLTLYVSMWFVLIGICWMHFGWRKLKVIGFSLLFILTMFPLPSFLNIKLMLQLRLISSKLGVSLIQAYGLPAYREGNIIDLGFTQLQVVEACSGLHSFISLFVLCLLLVYFFKDHWWKRFVLLISSIPLAIFANSVRIALTGILYNYWGEDVAQGFFHGFSGFMIFVFCIPVLFIEMKILEKLPFVINKDKQKKDYEDKKQYIDPNTEKDNPKKYLKSNLFQPVFILVVILLGVTLAFSRGVEFREKIPIKKSFYQFPLSMKGWEAKGRQELGEIYLDALDLSDYLLMDFHNISGHSVNLYVAYYESQSKGKSIHSPATCLPGSGWDFKSSGAIQIVGPDDGNGTNIKINSAIMQKGSHRQLSYYWFQQRGRILTNAYQLKLYAFWDLLTMQRSDGALVRLITPINKNEEIIDAEKRLNNFLTIIMPMLDEYIPGEETDID